MRCADKKTGVRLFKRLTPGQEARCTEDRSAPAPSMPQTSIGSVRQIELVSCTAVEIERIRAGIRAVCRARRADASDDADPGCPIAACAPPSLSESSHGRHRPPLEPIQRGAERCHPGHPLKVGAEPRQNRPLDGSFKQANCGRARAHGECCHHRYAPRSTTVSFNMARMLSPVMKTRRIPFGLLTRR